MEYKVVYAKYSGGGTAAQIQQVKELEAQVNALINQGWKPQGGICSEGNFYFQAMVK